MVETIEDFLTAEEEQQIINAIREAELNTSGEIRVHLESHCGSDTIARALEVFSVLGMNNTKLQNAVLIYVAINDHRFAICGDTGINKVVDDNFWDQTKDLIEDHFKNKQFAKGLSEGVKQVGDQLKYHFPYRADDSNELPDSISTS